MRKDIEIWRIQHEINKELLRVIRQLEKDTRKIHNLLTDEDELEGM